MANSTRADRRSVSMVWLRILAVATLVSTVGLIVLGSAVRVTNSGMGCKGWPLCTGSEGSISSFHPLMEESHRLLASVVTILIVALALSVRGNERAAQLRGPTRAAVAVIVVQIVLGAITVFANNAPFTVALHMLTATLFLAVATVVAVAAFVDPGASWSLRRGPSRLGWAAVSALYVILISGSVVVNAGAQSACPSWPVCGQSASSLGVVVIQMVHRSLVLVGSILVVSFMVSVVRDPRAQRALRTFAVVSLSLFTLQVAVGAMSAVWSAHTEIADVHLGVASVLWSSVVATFALSALVARPLENTTTLTSDRVGHAI
ncbi:MAG: COX15/CtaA family protein [Actinomycetota bacterium]|jgi:heme A synthase|nr:COX15/CtaA family protein [Actinomycetota bacterium]